MNINEMLSETSIKEICEYFGGNDSENFPYKYKSHEPLVDVLQSKFHCHDLNSIYPCSRWKLTKMALQQIWGMNQYNEFFTTILSIRFIMSEHPKWNAVQCSEASKKAFNDFNVMLASNDYELIKRGSTYLIVKLDSTLKKIGEGGFAIVYKIDGTNTVKKVLKEEHLSSSSTLSRFKGEYEISKSLEGMPGIIKVYDYDENNPSYTLEYHSQDLSYYIKHTNLDLEHKKLIIFELLEIMKNVHNKDIIHRDLAPHNIFIEDGRPIIADFGLGKNLNKERSHQTYDTASQGTLEYCDPRQYQNLSLGDKQSDIYSLGKLINFILTTTPSNTKHDYELAVLVAINEDLNVRYKTIEQFINELLKIDKVKNNKTYNEECLSKIKQGIYDNDMNNYLLTIKGVDLVYGCDDYNFSKVYFKMFYKPELYPMLNQSLSETYDEIHNTRLEFELLDRFGYMMVKVLTMQGISQDIKMNASSLVYEIAVCRNRYAVQNYFKDAYKKGKIEYFYVSNLLEELK